jgi:hypothetical protein
VPPVIFGRLEVIEWEGTRYGVYPTQLRAGFNDCEVAPGDILSLRLLRQFAEQLPRLGTIACTRIGVRKPPEALADAPGEGGGLLALDSSFHKHPFSHVHLAEEKVCSTKARVNLQCFLQLFNRPVMLSPDGENLFHDRVDDERARV